MDLVNKDSVTSVEEKKGLFEIQWEFYYLEFDIKITCGNRKSLRLTDALC